MITDNKCYRVSELNNKKFTRRQILKAAGTAGLVSAFPAIVPSTVFGKNAPGALNLL